MRISRPSIRSACSLIALFMAGFLLRGWVTPGPVNLISSAQAQPGSRKCSARTLAGAYGIKFEGQKLGTGPLVSVSRITFDGVGEFTTVEIARLNGDPIQRTFTGPYTVNDDCTGFLDFSSNLSDPPHAAHGDFVIVDGGKEFFLLDNEEGWAASGVAKKQ